MGIDFQHCAQCPSNHKVRRAKSRQALDILTRLANEYFDPCPPDP